MADILLLEPAYKNKYPPLGLMKISYFHKYVCGDYVRFAKGKLPDALKDKKLELGYSMKCENRKKGYIKREKGRIKEVFCGKLMSNMAISYYKQMRVCNLFEKR